MNPGISGEVAAWWLQIKCGNEDWGAGGIDVVSVSVFDNSHKGANMFSGAKTFWRWF